MVIAQPTRQKLQPFWIGKSRISIVTWSTYNYSWLVVWNVWNMNGLFSISYISYAGDVILSIDELHHFSRWLLHHQPDRNSSLWIGKSRISRIGVSSFQGFQGLGLFFLWNLVGVIHGKNPKTERFVFTWSRYYTWDDPYEKLGQMSMTDFVLKAFFGGLRDG